MGTHEPMKGRIFLFAVILLTVVVEATMVISVYQKVGAERLPFQAARILFQLAVIFWLYESRSHRALLVLAGYHIFTAILGYGSVSQHSWLTYTLCGFHIGCGFAIYFHNWFEGKEADTTSTDMPKKGTE